MPPEVRARYVTIIDSVLATSDIEKISKRKIRMGIQEAVEYDITPQKVSEGVSVPILAVLVIDDIRVGRDQGADLGAF